MREIGIDALADAIARGATVRAVPPGDGLPHSEGRILGHTAARNRILLHGTFHADALDAEPYEDWWEVELLPGTTLYEVEG